MELLRVYYGCEVAAYVFKRGICGATTHARACCSCAREIVANKMYSIPLAVKLSYKFIRASQTSRPFGAIHSELRLNGVRSRFVVTSSVISECCSRVLFPINKRQKQASHGSPTLSSPVLPAARADRTGPSLLRHDHRWR